LNFVFLVAATADHKAGSPLARLESWILFVDHIKTATTANNLTVAIPIFKSFKRANDFHTIHPALNKICKGGE
jgi:hypothetical protein